MAVSLEVIEQIADVEGFVKTLNYTLKPRGYLIFSTPKVGYWNLRLRHLLKAEVLQKGIYLMRLNSKILSRIVEITVVEILKRNSIGPAGS